MKYPKVSIIILNWNGWEDTIECLESLYQINYPNYDVILVDNASSNDSLKKIKEYCDGKIEVESNFFRYNHTNKPIKLLEFIKGDFEINNSIFREFLSLSANKRLILIKNDKNYGFAKGNNIGIEYAIKNLDPRYVLLLNNDTVVDKCFLNELINCGERKENIAAIQSAIYYYNDKNKLQSLGGNLNIVTGGEYNLTANEDFLDCDRLIGAAMLIKLNAIEKVGLIDEKYFLYMEETDWCYRAKKKGFKLEGCKKSKVWHKLYSSSGKNNPILNYYWTRNMILFYIKNCKQYLPIFMIFFSIKKCIQIVFLMSKLDFLNIKAILYGFIDGILNKKGLIQRSI